MNADIFVGIYTEGILYADRQQEVERDYKRIAFLFFGTLELEVKDDCPPHLASDVREHAAGIQSRRGERFEISQSGQSVTLGHALPSETRLSAAAARVLAAFEEHYVKGGYLYSGAMGPLLVAATHFDHDEGAARRTLNELVIAGAIVRRDCTEEMYQLTAPRRAALIARHGLARAWEEDETASAFAPNDERFGEVACALRAVGGKYPPQAQAG